MGGAAGHLQHVFEDLDLSFHDIKTIIFRASTANLEKVSEKLDGINLMFSWNSTLDELRVARNAGNIKSGGLSSDAIADMFKDRGNLTEAFNQAFVVLNKAFSALSIEDKQRYFKDTKTWYSVEIIYTKNPNVINYDKNTIVFHSWPVLTVVDNKIEKDDNAQFVDEIDNYISQMQKIANKNDWNIIGPVFVKMKDFSSGQIAKSTISKLESVMSLIGVSDSDTLGDFLRLSFIEEAKNFGISDVLVDQVVSRCLGAPNATTLTDLKRLTKTNAKQLELVTNFVKSSTSVQKKIMQPIETLIHDFAVVVLANLKSMFIQDNDLEILRLRQEVSKAITAIKSTNDTAAMEILQTHLTKLGTIENITSPMEGVVFMYNGNAYKFTGAFAPANQLLGLFRYRKKSCNKMNH